MRQVRLQDPLVIPLMLKDTDQGDVFLITVIVI